jgi:uncharacterized protein YqhQ
MYSCLSSSFAKISLLSNFRRISHLCFSSFTKEKNLHTSRIHNEALQKQNTQTSGMPLSLSLSLSLSIHVCVPVLLACLCVYVFSLKVLVFGNRFRNGEEHIRNSYYRPLGVTEPYGV